MTPGMPVEGCQYRIISGCNLGMVLDVSQNPNDYNKLIVYAWNHNNNQKFYFKQVGANKFGIFCCANNQTLEVENGNQNGLARIISSQPNKAPNEIW